MTRIETVTIGVVLALLSSPAIAGEPNGVPAPAAGIGIAAAALIGLGYRALKGRMRR